MDINSPVRIGPFSSNISSIYVTPHYLYKITFKRASRFFLKNDFQQVIMFFQKMNVQMDNNLCPKQMVCKDTNLIFAAKNR